MATSLLINEFDSAVRRQSGTGLTAAPDPFNFGDRPLGTGLPCLIAAEIGQNHDGSMKNAMSLIDMAIDAKCDAVKFQKRDINCELTVAAQNKPYRTRNSFGKTYGEHRRRLELSESQHSELRQYAEEKGITYFCTACDLPSVEMMLRIDNPVFKIASRDLTNIPLLEYIGGTGKPTILSTGMSDMHEIASALEALGTSNVLLTHCVSQYPTDLANVNLRAMATLAQEFSLNIGLSDHTIGATTAIASVAMGACFIEKHITLSRRMRGTDHAVAMEEPELRQMVNAIREVELAMGDGVKRCLPDVRSARDKLARSLTTMVTVPAGTVLSDEHVVLKSPGDGIAWKDRHSVIGKRARLEIPADTTLSLGQFEG